MIHYYMAEDDDDEIQHDGVIRTIMSSHACDNDNGTYDILLDSGADASIFPASLFGKGELVQEPSTGRLCDAQGVEIPIDAVQYMEVRLQNVSGKVVVLRERAAVSSSVSQPILSYGHLMEEGWTIDGAQ